MYKQYLEDQLQKCSEAFKYKYQIEPVICTCNSTKTTTHEKIAGTMSYYTAVLRVAIILELP